MSGPHVVVIADHYRYMQTLLEGSTCVFASPLMVARLHTCMYVKTQYIQVCKTVNNSVPT